MKIYVASSWRNEHQLNVVNSLRCAGHEVYDFKNPPTCTGFSWKEIDPDWENWSTKEYLSALKTPPAERGFRSDMMAMKWADAFVLVLPCGRSAHLELGWACGQGKLTMIYSPDRMEPELMVKMCDLITDEFNEILDWLKR